LLSLLIPNTAPLSGSARRHGADGFEPIEPLDPDPVLLH
jgi:hypothetical protein